MCVVCSVSEYIEGMESKVKPLLEQKKLLSDSDMEKYGMKDAETYPHLPVLLSINAVFWMKHNCLWPMFSKHVFTVYC